MTRQSGHGLQTAWAWAIAARMGTATATAGLLDASRRGRSVTVQATALAHDVAGSTEAAA